jgi:hypothetical protein
MIFSFIHEMANFVISLFLGNESCTANINIIAIQGRVAYNVSTYHYKSNNIKPNNVPN